MRNFKLRTFDSTLKAQHVNTGNLLRFNLINSSKDCNCKLNAIDI